MPGSLSSNGFAVQTEVVPVDRIEALNNEQIADLKRTNDEVTCLVPAGGALLLRPLLLHASSPAKNPRHRRVIHLEYAADPLPAPLRWFERATG